jgi:hypothetical protein
MTGGEPLLILGRREMATKINDPELLSLERQHADKGMVVLYEWFKGKINSSYGQDIEYRTFLDKECARLTDMGRIAEVVVSDGGLCALFVSTLAERSTITKCRSPRKRA